MGFTPTLFKPFTIILLLSFLTFITHTANADQKILVWGDSLSAAYGIPIEKGWVNLMREKLGDDFKVTNGSVSGETTSGGLTRLSNAIKKHSPDVVILELGANDGLRGLPPSITKNNLTKMIEQAKDADAQVILLGMKIPPNYGVAYSNKFEAIFKELAEKYKLPFIPFFLETIATDRKFFQRDQLHPTAEAQPLILDVVLPVVKAELKTSS